MVFQPLIAKTWIVYKRLVLLHGVVFFKFGIIIIISPADLNILDIKRKKCSRYAGEDASITKKDEQDFMGEMTAKTYHFSLVAGALIA